jgi:hypothetical protein
VREKVTEGRKSLRRKLPAPRHENALQTEVRKKDENQEENVGHRHTVNDEF